MGVARRLARGVMQRVGDRVERLGERLDERGAPVRPATPGPAMGASRPGPASSPIVEPPAPVEASPTVVEPSSVAPAVVDDGPTITQAVSQSSPDTIHLEATDVAAVRVELVRAGSATLTTKAAAPVEPPALTLVLNLRRRIEPRLDDLRRGVSWEQAADPAETLRRARVATRRLRCFLQLFEPIIGRERARPLRKRLRSVARGLGPLRDWDALIGQLEAEHAKADLLGKAALEHVMVWARQQREKEIPRARKVIAKGDLPTIADAVDAELDRVYGRILRLDDRLEQEATGWMEPVLHRTFRGMPEIGEGASLEVLHDVRLRAKKLRYSAELIKPVLGVERYRELRKPAKRVQRALGEHRDRERLAQLLQRRTAALRAQGLRTLANVLERGWRLQKMGGAQARAVNPQNPYLPAHPDTISEPASTPSFRTPTSTNGQAHILHSLDALLRLNGTTEPETAHSPLSNNHEAGRSSATE